MRTTVQLGLVLLVGLAACRPGDVAGKGGPVIHQHATPALQAALGITQEPFPSAATGRAFRTTPTVFGHGLLDAVPDAEILAREDPDDRDGDGISGRANRTADGGVGRFGRKANFATLLGEKRDRKSTRLNSSHLVISYAVFCLKKKKNHTATSPRPHRPHTPQRPA